MEQIPLRDAFVSRKKRFLLLDKGFQLAGFQASDRLLEPGCAGGEAAVYLTGKGYENLVAFDIDGEIVKEATEKCPQAIIMQADACSLPFKDSVFDGIYSEAAFSVIPNKMAAAAEYARVLKPGGNLLLNDFALKVNGTPSRESVQGIPMLEGVQTMEMWKHIFESYGFRCVYENEEFAELMRIALSLSKTYNIPPTEVSGFIVSAFGRNDFVDDFFSQTSMSYCQMIFEKV